MHVDADTLNRAQGCLLGQLAGDSLGSLVEFQSPEEILRKYPDGVRELRDGGTWGTLAGQPTDDSEMALMLARSLMKCRGYDPEATRKAYVMWLNSAPFDCGNTVRRGLRGDPDHHSQANGAMMRASPLGIFCCNHDPERTADFAHQDARLTHPHPVCVQANALFVMGLAHTIAIGMKPHETYEYVQKCASDMKGKPALMKAVANAATSPPHDYVSQQGWVLIAFQNALWQLLHAENLEEGVIDTVMRGGDTDTNAAIAGALLGAVYGLDAVPRQWRERLLNCRPERGKQNVMHPRPECFWPVDAMEIARCLVAGGMTDAEVAISLI